MGKERLIFKPNEVHEAPLNSNIFYSNGEMGMVVGVDNKQNGERGATIIKYVAKFKFKKWLNR